MPATMTEVEQLRDYIRGVMTRAEHHAGAVDEIVLALIGAVIWKKDADTMLEVRVGQSGQLANVLWVTISGKRYAFSYNHTAQTVELRVGSQTGPVLHSFSNTSTLADVKVAFGAL